MRGQDNSAMRGQDRSSKGGQDSMVCVVRTAETCVVRTAMTRVISTHMSASSCLRSRQYLVDYIAAAKSCALLLRANVYPPFCGAYEEMLPTLRRPVRWRNNIPGTPSEVARMTPFGCGRAIKPILYILKVHFGCSTQDVLVVSSSH